MTDVPKEAVCDECRHLFNTATGELVPGWEHVVHVTRSPLLCGRCKESVIKALEGGVPV